jgi:hypothetical protein
MLKGPLVLYVHPTWRNGGLHSFFMNPWWGNVVDKTASPFTWEMLQTYAFNTKDYTITDNIADAHMVFAPYRHSWLLQYDSNLLTLCEQSATEAGLPLLLDGTGDIQYPVTSSNTIVLRYGGYRFLPERGSIQIPLFCDDLHERYKKDVWMPRRKSADKPIVGFAGWTQLTHRMLVRTTIKELPIRLKAFFDERYRACTKGVLWRRRAIHALKNSSRVVLNLRERSTFSASAKTAVGDMRILQKEMSQTIECSDYALDVRGDANNSTRLFEILSLGRIPVILDTERNFPFRDRIDYSSFALIVDFRDVEKLPERIAEFHAAITPERFIEMQKNAREAFVSFFRIDAVMQHIVRDLHARLLGETEERV